MSAQGRKWDDYVIPAHIDAYARALEHGAAGFDGGGGAPGTSAADDGVWAAAPAAAPAADLTADLAAAAARAPGTKQRAHAGRAVHRAVRWPLFALVSLVIGFEFVLYLAARALVLLGEAVGARTTPQAVARQRMEHAHTYAEWKRAAMELDRLLGHDAWRAQDASVFYDWRIIQRVIAALKVTREQDDVHALVGVLNICLKNNFAGIENFALYNHCVYGAKQLVEQYYYEVDHALRHLEQADELDARVKRTFYRVASQNFGSMALCLSGGASFALYHLGVVKALLDTGLLPRAVSGTSTGALIAALVATRTNEELHHVLTPSLAQHLRACTEPVHMWMSRAWRADARFDARQWAEHATFFTRGSLTFREAHRRTGKTLSISVVPTACDAPPQLLNHITAPDCLIASAVLASMAVPGLVHSAGVKVPPRRRVVLLQKLDDGSLVPWHAGYGFSDASVRVDIPLQQLHEQFNVTYPVVSQVNAHVLLFGQGPSSLHHAALEREHGTGLFGALEHILRLNLRTNMKILRDLNLMPRILGHDVAALFPAPCHGAATIRPTPRIVDWLCLFFGPDEKTLHHMLAEGQKETFPKMHMISNRARIEKAIQRGHHLVRSDTFIAPSIPRIVRQDVDDMDATLSLTTDTSDVSDTEAEGTGTQWPDAGTNGECARDDGSSLRRGLTRSRSICVLEKYSPEWYRFLQGIDSPSAAPTPDEGECHTPVHTGFLSRAPPQPSPLNPTASTVAHKRIRGQAAPPIETLSRSWTAPELASRLSHGMHSVREASPETAPAAALPPHDGVPGGVGMRSSVQGRASPLVRNESGSSHASSDVRAAYTGAMPVRRGSALRGEPVDDARSVPATMNHMESSVTRLLVATKMLLESLTQWSQGGQTEMQVSEIYVRLGNDFNTAIAAFSSYGIDMSDMYSVPSDLRTCLETCLSHQASAQVLEVHLPDIREIIIRLLQGLKAKQASYRQLAMDQRTEPAAALMPREEPTPASMPHAEPTAASTLRAEPPGMFASSLRGVRTVDTGTGLPTGPRPLSAVPGSVPLGGGAADGRGGALPRLASAAPASEDAAGGRPHPLLDSSLRAYGTDFSSRAPPPVQAALPGMGHAIYAAQTTARTTDRGEYAPHATAAPALTSTMAGFPTDSAQLPALGASSSTAGAAGDSDVNLRTLRSRDALERRASKRFSAYTLNKMGMGPGVLASLGHGASPRTSAGDARRFSATRLSSLTPSATETDLAAPLGDVAAPPGDGAAPLGDVAAPLGDVAAPLAAPPADMALAEDRSGEEEAAAREEAAGIVPDEGATRERLARPAAGAGRDMQVFLQVGRQTRKVRVPMDAADGTRALTIPRLRMLFVDQFAYSPGMDDFPEIYIKDPESGVLYQLENMDDVQNRCLLTLNIEPLDQVKQHVDLSLTSVTRELRELKQLVRERDERDAHEQAREDTARHDARSVAPSDADFRAAGTRVSELVAGAAPAPAPTAGAPPRAPRTDARVAQELQAQYAALRELRHDFAVLRQTNEEAETGMRETFAAVRAQVREMDQTVSLAPSAGRALIESGKGQLDARSQEALTNVEDLQDFVEDLKLDVSLRGVKPKPAEMQRMSADIARAAQRLEELEQYVDTVKPGWKKTWETELQNIVDEQAFLNYQEGLLADLKQDHRALQDVFANIQQVVRLRDAGAAPDADAARPKFLPPLPDTGHEGLSTVMIEVRGQAVDHERRLRALQAAERSREKARVGQPDEFTTELTGFVDGNALRKTGGHREAERARQRRDQNTLRAMFGGVGGPGEGGGDAVGDASVASASESVRTAEE
ncbi:Bud site selection protein 6 [Malassezia sp. CBS 17886]|nr:Bud site selection protein 6 [Malassezia sp. CBS 17886]